MLGFWGTYTVFFCLKKKCTRFAVWKSEKSVICFSASPVPTSPIIWFRFNEFATYTTLLVRFPITVRRKLQTHLTFKMYFYRAIFHFRVHIMMLCTITEYLKVDTFKFEIIYSYASDYVFQTKLNIYVVNIVVNIINRHCLLFITNISFQKSCLCLVITDMLSF